MTSTTGNKPSKDRCLCGFTLIELIVIMALLTIVVSITYPALQGFFRGRKLDSEARRFLSLTRYGQSRAISEGVPMVLWVDQNANSYGLQAQAGYMVEDTQALFYDVEEGLEIEATAPPPTAQLLLNSTLTITTVDGASLPGIRFLPEGFVAPTSPQSFVIRQAEEATLWINLSTNRLVYEIQSRAPSPQLRY